MVGVLASVVAHLLFVSPPETDEAWASAPGSNELPSPSYNLGPTAVGVAINPSMFRAAVARRPVGTSVGTVVLPR